MNGDTSGTRPYGGLKPTTPQNEDGILIEPPMSEPVARVVDPAASEAPEPPLDPPGEKSVFHGFLVTPHSFVQVTGALENSGVVVLACTIPPASMMRCTKAAVSGATTSRSGSEPSVLRCPAIGASSLTATGSPSSGPSGSPCPAYLASAALAASSASSKRASANALMAGSTASARSITARRSSTGDSSLLRNIASASVADR